MGTVTPCLLVLLISLTLDLSFAVTWMTNKTEPWTFTCPSGETLKILDSVYENYDRVWNFSCITVPTSQPVTLGNCEWSGFVNQFQGNIHFQCHDDAVITGISSIHDDTKDDRMFQFQCCEPGSYVTHSCAYTASINNLQGLLYYRVPDGLVIRGVDSDYKSYDRYWRFNICKLDQVYRPKQSNQNLVGAQQLQ